MRILLLAFALAACTPPAERPADPPAAESQEAAPASNEANLAQMPSWGDARGAGVDFRAVGQEPGWLLDIYQRDRIRVLLDYGEEVVDFPLPSPTYPQEGATRYETRANGRSLIVTVRRYPCEDIMSGEPFPSTVEVAIDGRTLQGCGRSV